MNPTASDVPIDCRGSIIKTYTSSGLQLNYYRLLCSVTRNVAQQKFDIFHQLSKRPFTKRDCKDSGCDISSWQQTVSGSRIIVDARWAVSLRYVMTVVQLRVCKVPMDHNVNRIVTFTTSQLNNGAYCKGLRAAVDPSKDV